ncbi:MAG: signal peptidase I [Ignisphaera sp.]
MYTPYALLVILTVLVVSTFLSRFGYQSLFGVSVVISDSMEPTLRRGDMVLYARESFTLGDIVVYCLTPNHCIVHRVVDFMVLDTVNGYRLLIITKGDNVDSLDPPIGIEKIIGKVVFVMAREIWIPLLIVAVAYLVRDILKTPILGYSYAVLFTIIFVAVLSVYSTIPRPINVEPVKPPLVRLAGVYFQSDSCTLSIRYINAIPMILTEIEVNSTKVDIVDFSSREIVVKPSEDLLRKAFEYREPLVIKIEALLNRVGRLSGEYPILIGGLDPQISFVNGTLIARNFNCFPITINISIRYLDNNSWLWINRSYVIDGFSQIVIEPLEYAEIAYVYVYWLNQGEVKWLGLPMKIR